MLGLRKDFIRRPAFDDLALEQYVNTVGHLTDDREIMCDE
jgi:hypothetical protein